jgi:penicillin-binding protein 2
VLKKEAMTYWQRDHAWFASFAPAEDPEIAVVVLNEHGGHGGMDAAPTATARHEEVLRAQARGRQRHHRRLDRAPDDAGPARSAPAGAAPPPLPENVPASPAEVPSVAQLPSAPSEGAR